MRRGRRFVPVSHREVVALDNIVIVFMRWLTVGALDEEKVGIHLRHCGAFLEEWRYHLVRLGLPNDQLLLVLGVAEHIGANERLALIADHVALNVGLLLLQRDNYGDELGNFDAQRVLEGVHILHLSRLLRLFGAQNGVVVHFGEDSADSLQTKRACNQIDFVKAWVVQLDKTISLADLRWLVNCLNIASDALRVVRVLAEVAIKVADALL